MVARFGWMVLTATLVACAAPSSHNQVVDAIGTPFYLAFKIPVCAATLVVAAPLAGIAGLAEPSPNAAAHDPKADLDYGIRKNCGGPYALTSGTEPDRQ
jgi:hypothetical protein